MRKRTTPTSGSARVDAALVEADEARWCLPAGLVFAKSAARQRPYLYRVTGPPASERPCGPLPPLGAASCGLAVDWPSTAPAPRCCAMWVSYRPDQAWVALLLNIASSISCHKLAGVALARCLSRQVKNDPPTADRTAQLAGWAMGVLGRPIPRAPGAGGRYIGLEWAVASRFRPSQGG